MQTAGIGARVIHFVVDATLAFLLSQLAHSIWLFQVYYYRFPVVQYWVFFYAFMAIYPFFSEWFTGGRTVGKLITMSRAVTLEGRKPSLARLLWRNLLRLLFVIDPFLIPFTNGQTLHDWLSKTKVVTND